MDSQMSKMSAMAQKQDDDRVLIGQLLDELEESGFNNIAQLRKLYERGLYTNAFKENLAKLYQAHRFAAWLYSLR